jgi:hypothetical protein
MTIDADRTIRNAEQEGTAKAWHQAWGSQPLDSEARSRCAAEALIAAEREATAEAWCWALLCQPYGSEAKALCRARAIDSER